MRVINKYSVFSTRDDSWRYFAQVSEQPRLERTIHLVFHRVLEKPLEKIAIALDPWLERWHHRTCDNDCTLAYRTVGPDRKGKGDPILVCGRMPFDVEVDLLCARLGDRNSEHLFDTYLNKSTWDSLKSCYE
jgi:hypothetical protein